MQAKWTVEFECEIEALTEIPTDAVIVEIDGNSVAGICVLCSLPVFSTDRYYTDQDGNVTHGNCDR